MLAHTASEIETERAWQDANESRFALYCSLVLLFGILLGALLGQALGAAHAGALVVIEKTARAPSPPPVLALRKSLIFRTGAAHQNPTSLHAAPEARFAAYRMPLRLTLRQSPGHQVPLIQTLPAWIKNSAAFSLPGQRPVIAIIIDDLGPVTRATERALRLPPAVTLSFLPGARGVQDFARRARAGGHEILIHMPMEPIGQIDPGPHALMTGQSSATIERELSWAFARLSGYVGINNHMGSRFSRDRPGMETVLKKIKTAGLLYLDSRTGGSSVAPAVARALNMPFAVRDVFLDDKFDTSTILARLKETEALARRTGSAIAIAHPHDHSLDTLELWISTLDQRGLAIAPLTAVVRKRQAARLKIASAR